MEFVVLSNDEGQYGLFPVHLEIPAGWQDAGYRGSEAECIAFVDSVWTDIRPLSLRRTLG
jgi:MbtH protein